MANKPTGANSPSSLVCLRPGDCQVVQLPCDKPSLDVSLDIGIFEILTKVVVSHGGIIFSKLRQSFGRRFLFVAEVIDELAWRSDTRITEDGFYLLRPQ